MKNAIKKYFPCFSEVFAGLKLRLKFYNLLYAYCGMKTHECKIFATVPGLIAEKMQ